MPRLPALLSSQPVHEHPTHGGAPSQGVGRVPRWLKFAALTALVLLPFVLATVPVSGAVAAQGATNCDNASARHLLQRATFGARPGDVTELCTLGFEGWIDRQLEAGAPGTRVLEPQLEARLRTFAAYGRSMGELNEAFPPPQQLAALVETEALSARDRQARSPQRLQGELASIRLTRAVHSEAQLREVMTAFWFDHFNVHFQKGPIRWMVSDYEAHAIRAHVFGSFHDMLRATAQHPAMLTFLDNAQNVAADSMRPGVQIRPGTPPAMRARLQQAAANRPQARQQAGGNENYARELLELHTLGVQGGYTESDVQAVARAFTGWGVVPLQGAGQPGGFQFRAALHDVGEKTVLGQTLRAGGGQEDGEAVLRMLATHPSTARHVAQKLVQRFVNEGGDPELEADLAKVFLDTEGDLGAVTRMLFLHPRFQAPEHRGALFRTPFEFVVASARALNAEVAYSNAVLRYLREAGHVPYGEASPAGPPVEAAHWASSAGLLARMEFARALTGGQVDGVRPQLGVGAGAALAARRTNTPPNASPISPRAEAAMAPLFAILFPEGVPEDLRTEDPRVLVALGLGGPAFQRR